LLGLEVVMKAHVWFLIARLGGVTGGDAEYRSELIDQAIHHFDQWFLIGFHDTGQWMQNPLADGTADITNQYIRNGVDGGVLSVILFVVILVRCFSNLGSARKALQSHAADDSVAKEWFVWCLGCALFVHSVTIMTVEYFDQMRVVWNVLLAMIVGMSSEVLSNKAQESSSTDTDDGVSTDALQSSDGSPYFASGPEKTSSM